MKTKIILFSLICLTFLLLPWQAFAENFYKIKGEIYDSWQICRTRAEGVDGYFQISEKGFRPIIIYEGFASDTNIAYKLGQEFHQRYPDFYQRAEQIYLFARNRIRYTQDVDQFGYREFAQNADETAAEIEKGRAKGDCEDYAIFLATMYKAAGYRTAIVLIPGHAAALLYLPGYQKANIDLKFNGEKGWIWVEATGRNNPLGWYPQKALQDETFAYEIKEIEELSPQVESEGEIAQVKGKSGVLSISPFFSILFFMWIIPVISRAFLTVSMKRGR